MGDSTNQRQGNDADSLSKRLASSLGRASPKSPTEALQPQAVPPPPPRSRVSRHPIVVALNFLLTVAIVGVLVVGGAIAFGKTQFERPGDLDDVRTVNIRPGTALGTIADQLQNAGVIGNRWLFVAGVWFSKEQSNLKAGEYLVPAHASMRDIMEQMVGGRVVVYSVTVPEGLTSRQIVDCLEADTALVDGATSGLTERQIDNCRKAAGVLVGTIDAVPAEGSLLPDTYPFSRGDTRQGLIDRMRRDRDRFVADVWGRRAPDLPLNSPDELVTLASIVEKETSLADERSQVAAVYVNRLRLKMPLQADPTVVYALFKGEAKPAGYALSRADLQTKSPYNTYVNPGLPPGPIANPGRAALEAAANPSRTRDLYFVADGNGGHAFAETYDQHLRNVARYRASANAAPAPALDQPQGGDASVPIPAPAPSAN